MFKRLLNSKAFWLGIAGVFGAIGAFVAGEIEMGEAIKIAGSGLAIIFLRDGIAKK